MHGGRVFALKKPPRYDEMERSYLGGNTRYFRRKHASALITAIRYDEMGSGFDLRAPCPNMRHHPQNGPSYEQYTDRSGSKQR